MAGKWVFDSRFRLSRLQPDPARYHNLRQHFKGWEIETSNEAFNPQAATFLDFRTPQQGEMRFFYVLPFSERRALVEYVVNRAGACGEGHGRYRNPSGLSPQGEACPTKGRGGRISKPSWESEIIASWPRRAASIR
jgi:hypothetical protein